MYRNAKGAGAHCQAGKELPGSSGGVLDTAAVLRVCLKSAKDADARHQTGKELPGSSGGVLHTAAVLRVCLKSIALWLLLCFCSTQSWAVSDPFAKPARVRVFLFVRTDCPITNRYAPELQRIAAEFEPQGVQFWLVYPDPAETEERIGKQIKDYRFPGEVLRDPHHELVRKAHATVAPEAAVFDSGGRLIYHGRIDDRWVDVGKSRPAAQVHDLENAIAAALAGKRVAQPETRAIGCSLADVE